MTNPERGEIEIIVKEQPYTLRLSMNAAAAFEKKQGKTIGGLMNDASGLSFTAIRDLFWLLLQKHHQPEFRSLDQVGEWIDDAGGIAPLLLKIQELADVNRPDRTVGGNGENPQTAQSGIGSNSTEMPVEPD